MFNRRYISYVLLASGLVQGQADLTDCSREDPSCGDTGFTCIRRYVSDVQNPSSSGYLNAQRNDPDLKKGVENYKCYAPDQVEQVLALDRVKDPDTGVTSFYTVEDGSGSAGVSNKVTVTAATRRVRQHAKASLLIGAGTKQLSDNGYANCRFASNLEVNVLYCDGGKLIVQDAIQEDDVRHYLLPRKVRDTIASLDAKRFKFFSSELQPRMFYIQVGLQIYEFVRVKYGPGQNKQMTGYTMNFKSIGDISNLLSEGDGSNIIDFQFLGQDYGVVTYLIGNELEMKAWIYNPIARTVEEAGTKRLENWERRQEEGQGKFYNYKSIAEATYSTREGSRMYPAKILTISSANDQLQIFDLIDRRGQKLAEDQPRFTFELDNENPVSLRCKKFAAINRYVAISTIENVEKENQQAGENQARIAVYDVHAKTLVGSVYRDANEGTQMGHRILSIGYASDKKYYGGHGLKIIYSSFKTTSEVTVINVAFLYQEVEGAFKQVDAYREGEGAENKFSSKFVDFTAQGSHLVYQNADGWNVFLLAAYNQYYVASKKQTYESLGEFDEAEDKTEDGVYNLGLQSFTKFVPSNSPASTQGCQNFFGQADTLLYAFQKQDCTACSVIYENARSIEGSLAEGEAFTMEYDLYVAMQLCSLAGYTMVSAANWRDNWFVVHLVLILVALFAVCSICLCWAFCDCAKGSEGDAVFDRDIREKQLRGSAKGHEKMVIRRDFHPVAANHVYGSDRKYEQAPQSQRELITKREFNVTPGEYKAEYKQGAVQNLHGQYKAGYKAEYKASGKTEFTDIRSAAADTKIVAMRIEAEVPHVSVGHGYQSRQNVDVELGYQSGYQGKVDVGYQGEIGGGYQSKQEGNFVQSSFVTPAPKINVQANNIEVSHIKRVDSVPKQIDRYPEITVANTAIISKPAYHEEQIIMKSESAAHHQMNDAQIHSSGAASSNVVAVPIPSPAFVESKRIISAPRTAIESSYQNFAFAPTVQKTDVSAGYQVAAPVPQKTDISAGFIDDREPETIIQVVKEVEVQRVEVPIEVVRIEKVEVPVVKIVKEKIPEPKRDLVSTSMFIAKEVIQPPAPVVTFEQPIQQVVQEVQHVVHEQRCKTPEVKVVEVEKEIHHHHTETVHHHHHHEIQEVHHNHVEEKEVIRNIVHESMQTEVVIEKKEMNIQTDYIPEPKPEKIIERIIEKVNVPQIVEVPVEKLVEKIVKVEVPVEKIVKEIVEVEKIVKVEVEVEKIVEVDKIVEVEKIIEKIVEVEKIVEKPVIKEVFVDKIIEKEVIKEIHVPAPVPKVQPIVAARVEIQQKKPVIQDVVPQKVEVKQEEKMYAPIERVQKKQKVQRVQQPVYDNTYEQVNCRQVNPGRVYQQSSTTGFDGVGVLQWEVERQDRNMAQMARKVVTYNRNQSSSYIEIIESGASGEIEQYAIEMSSQAMREFCDYQMDAMAAFVRDQFDQKYGQHWNCIVGEVIDNDSVWRESEQFVYLRNGQFKFAIYKSAEGYESEEHDGPIRIGVAESTQQQRYNQTRGCYRQQVNNFVGDRFPAQRSQSRSKSPFRHGRQGYAGAGSQYQHHRGESGVHLLNSNRMGSPDREDQV